MQILPTTDTGLGFWNALGQQPDGAADFLQSMQEAMGSVNAGQNVSVSSAVADEPSAPLVEAPYNRTSTDGVTYTLEEVCFTKQELQELREELIKAGAPEAALRQFDILAGQPDGATLAQVMASLLGTGKAPILEDSDVQLIRGLLGKIDPSGELSDAALAQIGAGRGEEALDMVRQAFAKLGDGESIEVTHDEALALGKGLGLDETSLRAISSNFSGFNALYCTGEQFGNLMGPAAAQLMSQKTDRELIDAALEKTLKPVISKARNRMAKEKATAELQNRRVDQSRILIDRTVQEQSRKIMDQTVAGEDGRDSRGAFGDREGDGRSRLVGHAGENAQAGLAAGQTAPKMDSLGEKNAKAAANIQAATGGARESRQAAKTEPDAGARNTGQDSRNQNRESPHSRQASDLLDGKIDVRNARQDFDVTPRTQLEGKGSSIVYSMLQGSQNILDATVSADTAASQSLSRHVASQVENGMLSAMRDGATRLDLQLHPQELGTIGITLTMRNGEVSARIRSEKGETAEMVSKQLESIRINLEQQGIKVDKIEVQLQERDAGGGQWQDLQQHNSWQEEDARREQLARLKTLAGIRNGGRNAGEAVMEQTMTLPGQMARYASHALHVVA